MATGVYGDERQGTIEMDMHDGVQPPEFLGEHSAEIVQRLRQTQRPLTLTVNGKPTAE